MIQLPEEGQGKWSFGVGEQQRQTWLLWESGIGEFSEIGFNENNCHQYGLSIPEIPS